MSDKNLVYPDWVQQYRTRGKTVKKKGDNYYLYSRTSKRVPGKKHPQPVDTYIGVITPDGVINAKSKIVQVDVCDVYEFGFSKVLQVICPDEWKLAVGKDWEKILQILIQKESVNTYLVHDVEIPDPNGFDVSWGSQYAMLLRRIRKIYNVDRQDLEKLKYIYVVYHGKVKFFSRISQEQQAVLDRLQISNLEVC